MLAVSSKSRRKQSAWEFSMFRFVLGVLVGSLATASYIRGASRSSSTHRSGRVDELSTAAQNVIADAPLDAGDGTPGPRKAEQGTMTDEVFR
jgi:hypothetical protein